jgi:hypothetical protein
MALYRPGEPPLLRMSAKAAFSAESAGTAVSGQGSRGGVRRGGPVGGGGTRVS